MKEILIPTEETFPTTNDAADNGGIVGVVDQGVDRQGRLRKARMQTLREPTSIGPVSVLPGFCLTDPVIKN